MQKKCPKCGLIKDECEYGKRSEPPYYLRSKCRKCENEISKKYQSEHREEHISYCKQWHLENKEQSLEISRAWKKLHKERANELSKAWNYNNHDRSIENTRKWRENNIDRARENTRKWFKSNPVKNRWYARRRRDIINDIGLTFTQKEWEECLRFFDFKDAYTGLDMNLATIDHVIPISNYGTHQKANIVPCEKTVNSSKNNFNMELWYSKQPYFSEERLNKIHAWINMNGGSP